ncbi:MAG TPA: plasmid pRiA4b ORF-3 family protein [Candidatus Saccharimonadales bacterium]|nr:plasmid pRiA4b ORF-3 family protein [Candidatus Saccharimonadales bacterium]
MMEMTAMEMTVETNTKKPKTQTYVYEIRITLQDIRPPIWRLVQVPDTLPLSRLHAVLQTVIGWTDSHLHHFEKDGMHWGVPEDDEDCGIEIVDENRTAIGAILTTPGDSMLYVYDFGDNWRHDVTLEKILPALGVVRPVCIAGERHCPPEDVGGVAGYEEFLEVIFEPGHEEHEHYVRWAGGPSPTNRSVGRFQPEEFNQMVVNGALSRIRWPSASKRNNR